MYCAAVAALADAKHCGALSGIRTAFDPVGGPSHIRFNAGYRDHRLFCHCNQGRCNVKSISQLHQQCLAGRDAVCNWLFSGALDLTYVVESAEWAVAEFGRGICKGLVNHKLMKARVSRSLRLVRSRIRHFGSEHVACGWLRRREHQRAQANVLTWFHVVPDYSRNAEIAAPRERFVRVHTSCQRTKNELVKMGFDEDKIRVIPLGINNKMLSIGFTDIRHELRRRLGITDDVVVVGSFQKDGVGWGEGLEPKLVKGPDVFADVVEELAKKCKIHVLLVGPARGYVKHRLQAAGVPFTYLGYFRRYRDVWPWYSVLDVYLIASRIEGGAIFHTGSMGVGRSCGEYARRHGSRHRH
jgi:glycosyltransferase involved in cell wall biosynthesis